MKRKIGKMMSALLVVVLCIICAIPVVNAAGNKGHDRREHHCCHHCHETKHCHHGKYCRHNDICDQKAEPMGPNRMLASEDVGELERNERAETALWNNPRYNRGYVKKVVFFDSLEDIPEKAWDVSADGDKSVMAWLDRYTLNICADGYVILNEDASWLFSGFSNLREVDFNGCVDTSEVIDMSHMFSECRSLETLNFSGIDTSEVETMDCMFYYCNELTELDVSEFDTSRVKNMDKMFAYCTRLKELDVSNFNTGRATNLGFMFYHCKSLKTLDLSNFDTSRAHTMNSMFYHCAKLEYVDVSSFDTAEVSGMGNMFAGCPKLETPDFSNFDFSNVTFYENFMDAGRKIAGLSWEKYIKDFKAGKITPGEQASAVSNQDATSKENGEETDTSAQVKLAKKFSYLEKGLSKEAAAAYLELLKTRSVDDNSDYDDEEGYRDKRAAFIYDINDDGILELVLNETSSMYDNYAIGYSVFQYVNGEIKTLIEFNPTCNGSGDYGGYGSAFVVNLKGKPRLIEYFHNSWSIYDGDENRGNRGTEKILLYDKNLSVTKVFERAWTELPSKKESYYINHVGTSKSKYENGLVSAGIDPKKNLFQIQDITVEELMSALEQLSDGLEAAGISTSSEVDTNGMNEISQMVRRLSPEMAKAYLDEIYGFSSTYLTYKENAQNVAAFMYDLNGDGVPELVVNEQMKIVSTEYGGEPWDSYSVFGYENGKLEILIEREELVPEDGGHYGLACVTNVKKSPTLVTFTYCADEYPGKNIETTLTIYGSDLSPKYVLMKRTNTSSSKEEYFINDEVVKKDEYEAVMNEAGLTSEMDVYNTQDITVDELVAQLEAQSKA